MNNRTETIVTAYLDGMRARYAWAQGDTATAQRGLTLGAETARRACAGQLKLDGEAWHAALAVAGFTVPYTAKALAVWCEDGAICDAIALAFVAELRATLTVDQWEAMRAKNSMPEYGGGICASHDYCDANMQMAYAFEAVMGRESDCASDADAALWSDAWAIAKAAYLTAESAQ